MTYTYSSKDPTKPITVTQDGVTLELDLQSVKNFVIDLILDIPQVREAAKNALSSCQNVSIPDEDIEPAPDTLPSTPISIRPPAGDSRCTNGDVYP